MLSTPEDFAQRKYPRMRMSVCVPSRGGGIRQQSSFACGELSELPLTNKSPICLDRLFLSGRDTALYSSKVPFCRSSFPHHALAARERCMQGQIGRASNRMSASAPTGDMSLPGERESLSHVAAMGQSVESGIPSYSAVSNPCEAAEIRMRQPADTSPSSP